MAKYQNKTKQGFTIIEVVLVLAIGGLIMLMVFLALPALQRSQRDTQRRNQLGEFGSQLVQYQSNNRGRIPGSTTGDWASFMHDYLRWSSDRDDTKNEFMDPDGEIYIPKYECELGVDPCKNDPVTDANSLRTGNSGWTLVKQQYDTFDSKTFTATANKDEDGDFNHTIHIFKNARCNGEQLEKGTGSRNVAFTMKLENGWYCGTN